MSTGLPGIIRTLETLAEYDGPWRVFRGETVLLRARLDELREREHRLDDVLLVALVGAGPWSLLGRHKFLKLSLDWLTCGVGTRYSVKHEENT